MSLQVGETAPPFVAPELTSGVPIALNDYLDRTTVVVFSGLTWCPPCQFEAPILQEIWAELSGAVQFIVISLGDPDQATLQNAVQQFVLTMPVIQDDFSIAKDWIYETTPNGGTKWSVPKLFVLQPQPGFPAQADHHVVCNQKSGAAPPEAQLKADIMARIEVCSSSSSWWPGYWEEYNPVPWIDPGPLKHMSPERRDLLIALGIGDLARNLSNPATGHRLERLAADASFAAARALRSAARRKTTPPQDMKAIETRLVKE